MALNQNHLFDELEGVKCSVVEKNCTESRVVFLKELLERNRFTVVVVRSPAPKTLAKPAVVAGAEPLPSAAPILPETFTVGVTDVTFNPVNAIYNRELFTLDGQIVSPDYWKSDGHAASKEAWYWKST